MTQVGLWIQPTCCETDFGQGSTCRLAPVQFLPDPSPPKGSMIVFWIPRCQFNSNAVSRSPKRMRVSFHSVFRYSGNGSRFPGERVEEIIPDASCDVSEYFLKEISFPFN